MTRMRRIVPVAFLVLVCLSYSSRTHAQARVNRVTAGEFLVDPPTLINLGFEWFMEGDDNRNATVEVRFRKAGDTAWRQGLPLLRLQREEIYNGAQLNNEGFTGRAPDLGALEYGKPAPHFGPRT